MSALTGDRPTAAILWMMASGFLFVLMAASVRYLGTNLPTVQATFLRFAIGLGFLLPILAQIWRKGLPQGTKGKFFWRGLCHAIGVTLWFYALARLPVAEVTAIGYLTPILTTIGAAIFFRDRLTKFGALCLILAMIGGMVILRPGLRELQWAHLAQVLAAVLFAISFLFAKRLSQQANPSVVVAMMTLAITVFLAPFAISVWQPIATDQILLILTSAILATVANFCHAKGYALAPLTVTQPIGFLQMIWASLIGLIVFGEGIDLWVVAGAAMIILAAALILWSSKVAIKTPIAAPLKSG